MIDFIEQIKKKAQSQPKRIVYPEATEERVLKSACEVLKEKIATLILLGNPDKIRKKARELNLDIDFDQIEIHDPETSPKTKTFAEKFYELRKHKPGMTQELALKTMKNINYFGTMMVYLDEVDGMVSGTIGSTSDTIRPALQIIKTREPFHKVSGIFIMVMENRLMLFADTAVNIEPNSHELADIAVDTVHTARKFGIEPKVALLSFSTAGSTRHPLTDKVKEATLMAQHKCPNAVIDGEMQVDAAIVPEVAARKCPNSKIQGDANILIFPDLQAGNIAYKLVERLAKAKAIGPILQGLKKPVNDLSRGCSYQDIVNVTAITVCEAQQEFKYREIVNNLNFQ